jgi:uncharacterized protein (DUF433 family)
MSLATPITSNSEVMGGAIVFRGTRVPVQTLIDYLEDGFTIEKFIEFFPSVNESDAWELLKVVGRDNSPN